MSKLNIRIDPERPEPLSRQITEQIVKLIEEEKLRPKELLPGERTLATSVGVGRDVVRRSYHNLETLGLIEVWGLHGRRVRAEISKNKRLNSAEPPRPAAVKITSQKARQRRKRSKQ